MQDLVKTKSIVIIDYGLGNNFSIYQAFKHLGYQPLISADKSIISSADAIVLPGVGSFGHAMENLEKLDLITVIKNFYYSNKPIFGICLGMQILFSNSEECNEAKGLDLISGTVCKIPFDNNRKIPHIGWNYIKCNQDINNNSPLSGIEKISYMYFVHSYYVKPDDEISILSLTSYMGHSYVSSVLFKNIFATQFHPEKSGKTGLDVIRNWVNQIN